MKKININIIIPMLVVVLTAMGCSDDLERNPFSSIPAGESFLSYDDALNWDAGMYGDLRGRVGGTRMYVPDIQADQLNATQNYGNRNGFPHRWEQFLAADGTIQGIWSGYYSGIRDVNVALAGFDNLDLEDPAERADLNIFTGDAYFARAFYYFKLANRFAKTYDAATASTDLGVPLVLEYDVNAQPGRATLQETYAQILSDLAEARARLSGVAGSQGSNYFNIDVVNALEAKVRFNMGDWSGAKTIADNLIASNTYPLITSEVQLANMWVNDFAQEVIFQPFVSAPSELGATAGLYLQFRVNDGAFLPDWLPSQWVIDMYDDTDFRKGIYFDQKPLIEVQGQTYNDLIVVNKYPGNPALFTGATTNYQHSIKVFRIAEMYLISAECAANLPSGDIATPLNALRTARGLTAIGAPTMQDVMDERFRELAFEGFRLDDLKRWGLGFTRRNPQNETPLVNETGFFNLSIPAGHDKFIWAIPARDITVNPNLAGQQNPGW